MSTRKNKWFTNYPLISQSIQSCRNISNIASERTIFDWTALCLLSYELIIHQYQMQSDENGRLEGRQFPCSIPCLSWHRILQWTSLWKPRTNITIWQRIDRIKQHLLLLHSIQAPLPPSSISELSFQGNASSPYRLLPLLPALCLP